MTTPTGVRVHPLIAQDAERVWGVKESACAGRDHADISPIVTFFRDGQMVANLHASKINRDYALAIIRVMTAPTMADLVVMHADAHMSNAANNPTTGKPWGPHEMQNLCDTEGACATGLLTDCIATTGVFKGGHAEQITRPYHGHEKAGGLHWHEADHLVEDGKCSLQGLIADTIRDALADDQFQNILDKSAAELGISEDELPALEYRPTHLMCVSVRFLACMGVVGPAILLGHDQTAADIIKRSMTQEEMERTAASPLGLAARVLAAKWGLDD